VSDKLENLLFWARLYFKAHHCKPKLRVSVSGGRTSMFMAKWCKENLVDYFDILFMFANTSREHTDTYRFLEAGDRAFGLGLVLIEAVVHKKEGIEKACTGKVVRYHELRKDGSIFREVCAAYGLPNQTFKLCTRELKTNPMDKYAASIGFGDALVAIGIRSDETRRVSKNATKNSLIYPLVDFVPTTKQDVLDYFEQFDWDLRIPEWDGNCIDCHKKSDLKLLSVYTHTPEVFEWSQQLDCDFKHVGPNSIAGVRVEEPRKRWRGYRDTRELLEALRSATYHPVAVTDGGCSESCEVYETEEV
jgi:hypothetical protein